MEQGIILVIEIIKYMKVVFAGTPQIVVPTLEALHKNEDINVIAVFTKPDSYNKKLKVDISSPVKRYANKNGIQVYQPKSSKEFTEEIKELSSTEDYDILLTFSYGYIISNEALSTPLIAPINIHGSILPDYRGSSPVHQSILNADKVTGITYIIMDEKMDHGPIIATQECELKTNDDINIGFQKLSKLASSSVCSTLLDYAKNRDSNEQDHSNATYTKMIKKDDGKVDLKNDTANYIYRKFLTYKNWPGVITEIKGIKIQLIDMNLSDENIDNSNKELIVLENKKIYLRAKDTYIQVNEVRVPGKKSVDAVCFFKSNRHLWSSDS